MAKTISAVLPPMIPSDPQSWQSQGKVGHEAEKEYLPVVIFKTTFSLFYEFTQLNIMKA